MKFTEEQRYAIIEAVYNHVGDEYDKDEHGNAALKLDSQDIKFLNCLESIIQDRGNSIQEGWIDVEEKMPLEHGYYYVYYSNEMDNGTIIALFRGSDFFHGSIYPMADVKFWQPLPSAPK